MNALKSSIPTVRTPNLALAAFACARYDAVLIDHQLEDGKVYFTLALKTHDFPTIEKTFFGGGDVSGIAYSEAISRFKKLVRLDFDAAERGDQ